VCVNGAVGVVRCCDVGCVVCLCDVCCMLVLSPMLMLLGVWFVF